MTAAAAAPGWWLGLRWTVPRDAAARRRASAIMAGAGITAFVAVLLWALLAGAAARQTRADATWPAPAEGRTAFTALDSQVPWQDTTWTTRFLAPQQGTPPAPPGLDRFPAPGEVWVSQATSALLRSHPDARRRLPGPVTGLIRDEGLESPDQLLVVTGRPRGGIPYGFTAASWGATTPGQADRPALPVPAMSLVVAGLVGLPLLLFGVVVARMSAASRLRRAATLHLLGVPARTLSRAAALESALLGGAGALIGILAAMAALTPVARSGALGIAWFPADTRPGPVLILGVVTVIALGLARAASAGTRRALREVTTARAGAPTGRRALRLLPVVCGAGVLTGVIALKASSDRPLPEAVTLLMLAGIVSVTVGATLALAPAFAAAARALRPAVCGPALLLAVRRLELDAATTARAATGVVLLFTVGITSLAPLAVIEEQNLPRPQGHRVVVQPSGGYGAAAATAVLATPVRGMIVDLDAATTAPWAATCGALTFLAGTATRSDADRVRRTCVPGEPYWLSATPGDQPPPGTAGTALSVSSDDAGINPGGTYRTTPVEASELSGRTSIYAFPGPGDDTADRFVTAVLAADPQAAIHYSELTTIAGVTAQLRRIILVCLGAGMLISVAAFLVAHHDQQRERARHTAALTVIGVPRRVRAAAAAAAHLVAGSIACLIGTAAGALCAAAYLSLAADHPGAARVPERVGPLVAVTVLLVVLAAAAEARSDPDDVDPELLRRG